MLFTEIDGSTEPLKRLRLECAKLLAGQSQVLRAASRVKILVRKQG